MNARKSIKRSISFCLLLAICIAMMSNVVSATANTPASGTGADGIQWILEADGTLILYGQGSMEDNVPAGAGYGSWIGHNLFSAGYNNRHINKILVADGIARIGESAFAWAAWLTTAVIDEGVVEISDWAFLECSNLTSIYIPATVTKIGDQAFHNCPNLTDVYYAGSEEQWTQIKIGSANAALKNARINYNHSYSIDYDIPAVPESENPIGNLIGDDAGLIDRVLAGAKLGISKVFESFKLKNE